MVPVIPVKSLLKNFNFQTKYPQGTVPVLITLNTFDRVPEAKLENQLSNKAHISLYKF